MALVWDRRRVSTDPAQQVFDNFVLAQLPAGQTLKRTIVSWYVWFPEDTTANARFFLAQRVWWSVQVTYGEPPGFPINPATQDPNTTDMLDWGVANLGLQGGSQELWTTTAVVQGDQVPVDTPAQRRSFTYPSIVWFAWGLDTAPVDPFVGGSTQLASSVLVDDHM